MGQPPTDEERASYKAAYREYRLASGRLWSARQSWLPDHPELPVGPWWAANNKIQQELIAEVEVELQEQAKP